MGREPVVLETRGEEETRAAGMRVARVLRGGERIGLSGELGAGKTCFVRGLAEGLGVDPAHVRSPSFTLVISYESGRLPLHHIDAFRLVPGVVDPEGMREYLYGSGVCAVEWFERLAEPLEEFVEIRLTIVNRRRRRLVAIAHGLGYDAVLDALSEGRVA